MNTSLEGEKKRGQVVKLDRGYPLVRLENGDDIRCEHATELVKETKDRCVIGDHVSVKIPEGHEKGIVVSIFPRTRQLVRKDPAERAVAQVLAANFDTVIIAQPLAAINMGRLERELVLAHQTGANVAVVLTKADLVADDAEARLTLDRVRALAGGGVEVVVVSNEDDHGVDAVRKMIPQGQMAVLVGRSGVGKSSLINMLVGAEVQSTSAVREGDGKGRHTTVSREIVRIPGGGFVVDMPGVRGLGVWEAEEGVQAAFSDIEELSEQCRFRDCSHTGEPGCAVLRAVKRGELSQKRLDSYLGLTNEIGKMRERKEDARRASGIKTSDEKAGKPHGKSRKSRAQARNR